MLMKKGFGVFFKETIGDDQRAHNFLYDIWNNCCVFIICEYLVSHVALSR